TAEMVHPSYPAVWLGPLIDRQIYSGPLPVPDAEQAQWSKKYINNFAVLECPSDRGDRYPLWAAAYGDKNMYQIWGTSYWYNCRDNFAYADDAIPGSLMNKAFGKLRNSSRVILLGEPEMHAYAGNGDNSKRWCWHDLKRNYANILFADLHAAGIEMTWRNPDYQNGRDYTFLAK
ncbi:MAG TPA: hypothetical protein VNL70_03965, partial [Tepidisphaeraceae bacterium]|nr:hypothetical protein [Tepidisphaeraceae bacterium]